MRSKCERLPDSHMASILSLLETAELPHINMKPREGTLSVEEVNVRVKAIFVDSEVPRLTRELSRAAILLWHDHFEAAHQIAQGIENANGSFLHGILHRREPDYANARYWFRRTGQHPAFGCIAGKIKTALASSDLDVGLITKQIAPNDKWDPLRFINFLEASVQEQSEPMEKFLRQAQSAEIQCYLGSLPNH